MHLVDRVVTVRLNDVVVIEEKTIGRVTTGALDDRESEPGPIMLHAHSVGGSKFRNIVITPLP